MTQILIPCTIITVPLLIAILFALLSQPRLKEAVSEDEKAAVEDHGPAAIRDYFAGIEKDDSVEVFSELLTRWEEVGLRLNSREVQRWFCNVHIWDRESLPTAGLLLISLIGLLFGNLGQSGDTFITCITYTCLVIWTLAVIGVVVMIVRYCRLTSELPKHGQFRALFFP